jgi:hypothetical protein
MARVPARKVLRVIAAKLRSKVLAHAEASVRFAIGRFCEAPCAPIA